MAKNTAIFVFLSLFILAQAFAEEPAVKPLAFQDCLNIARQNSYDYKSQSEKVKQTSLARLKAIGGILPTLSLTHSRDYGYDNTADGNGFSDMGWESVITAKQPVFYGGGKILNISLADREAYKEEQNLKTVERQLGQNAAQAFFALASAQADLTNEQESLGLMQDRVRELKAWLNIGKSKPSEVYAAESSAALIAAQLEDAKAAVEAAADRLALVMGVENVIIQQPVETDAHSATVDASASANSRSDVKAAMAEKEAQERRIQMGAGAFLPQVDLSLTKPIGGTPYLGNAAYKDTGWQLMLTANWPFFEGGSRVFDSLSALSQEESLKQQMLSTLANVKYEIKSRARDLAASENSVRAMKDAYDKAEKSLKAQQADYKNGLVTNVDVIQALTTAESVKQALDREIMQKELNKALLEISLQ